MKHLSLSRMLALAAALLAPIFAYAVNPLGVPDSEYNALVALYNATNGPGWYNSTNWLTSKTPWYGVTVTGGRVTWLVLPNNRLIGVIPNSLGDLAALQDLDLCCNRLTGPIPVSIGNLTNLWWLDLSYNELTGAIPGSIGNLTLLEGMDLGGNQLTGPIPASIGNLTSLWWLHLGGNRLTGSIPDSIGNLANLESLELGNNQLTGAIPNSIGNLTYLQDLWLGGNQLTGAIPSSIGNLTNLRWLDLSWNDLTGAIPGSIGNLTNLECMHLFNNRLTGAIPDSIGNLKKLQDLSLDGNKLTGAIPDSIGNMTFLRYLWLNSNRLTGRIPGSIVQLSSLYRCNLSYNGLWTSDRGVSGFLDARCRGWYLTQTVAPRNVTAVPAGPSSALVSWTPIPYTGYSGYYEVGVSATPGGPYTFDPANRTADKFGSALTVAGLPPGPAYFVVRTVTLAGPQNQSDLTSDPSDEATILILSRLSKAGADGSSIIAGWLVTTAVFNDCFYVEDANRACGIRVQAAGGFPPLWATVRLSGTLRTNADGERYVQASEVVQEGTGGVLPLSMSNRRLGGGNWLYNPATGAGQRGITGNHEFNNIGMLVQIWGKVTARGRGWFYVDDGSKVQDGTGISGIYVEASGLAIPTLGSFVFVTGISSCQLFEGNIVTRLLPRDQGDIVVVSAGLAASAASAQGDGAASPRGRNRIR